MTPRTPPYDPDDRPMTRHDWRLERAALVATLTWRHGLITAAGIGLIKFSPPEPVTVGALALAGIAIVAKALLFTKIL